MLSREPSAGCNLSLRVEGLKYRETYQNVTETQSEQMLLENALVDMLYARLS